ncbi:hypothetical protein [Escherichia coli]|uniref:hypothetical protein n=1 Tax=Escherichia coli TaxID=562 RepID=UPI000AC02291|nr:hypothetical protein [Escherichia coli]
MPDDPGQAGGRINARLPAPGKDRAPVALKGAALTRRPFHYADVLMGASVSSCLSFVCY